MLVSSQVFCLYLVTELTNHYVFLEEVVILDSVFEDLSEVKVKDIDYEDLGLLVRVDVTLCFKCLALLEKGVRSPLLLGQINLY